MTDMELIKIGAENSTPGQDTREFTEGGWLSAARAIAAAERERCAQVCLGLWDIREDERARMYAAKCADAIRDA